ncbi:MFS transporter [Sphaerisporangium sp. NPDC051011]|uniref:MFS transporter n=1 Tax=Sphaerisporangium sp. NPDC051011 TaxID=3155792 RepID=UPI0033F78F73
MRAQSRGRRRGGVVRAVAGVVVRRLSKAVGGTARLRVIALIGCVLALDSADKGAVGALAVALKRSLELTNTELGALTAVSSAAGALAVVPIGLLTDRVRRVRLLYISIGVWSLAMAVGALADSFLWLLLSRVALGAVAATAGPTVTSLVGDFFAPGERARIYGFILAGEMLGTGVGLLIGGDLAQFFSWRFAFWFLALFGGVLMCMIARFLPEPARGGEGWLLAAGPRHGDGRSGGDRRRSDAAHSFVREQGVEPYADRVLRRDPARMSLWDAARYVLGIRTNVILIVASAVGYFFFAGVRGFGVIFVDRQYGLGPAAITGLVPLIGAGALAGVLTGGRLADHLIRRGHLSARMIVPALAYLAAAAFFVPALLTSSLTTALPVLLIAGAALAAANPPLDAARLDVVHFRLWGRAESIRTLLRTGAEATAPISFGLLADVLGTGGPRSAHGVLYAFLIMLLPLAANAVLLLRGRRAYPRDVATAVASERLTRGT